MLRSHAVKWGPRVSPRRTFARLPFVRISGHFLCLASLTLLGCADLLGLKSLTYDGAEERNPPALVPPGDGDGDGDVFASGGAPGGDDDFPASFAASSVWGASPDASGEPYYWVYDPSTETLSSFILRIGAPDLLGHQSWPFAGTLKTLAAVPTSQSTILIGYDPQGATASHVTGADGLGNLTTLLEGPGTSGRTALLATFTGAEWVVLTYSESDGTYRYFRSDPENSAVFSGQWDPGWTSVSRFSAENVHGVIKHNRNTRRLTVDRFDVYGSALEEMGVIDLDFDATIVTVFSLNGQHALLFYQEGTGAVTTARLKLKEQSVAQGGAFGSYDLELEVVGEGVFRGDVTQIVTLSHSEGPFAITFSAHSGKATLASLQPLNAGGPIVVR